MKKSISFLLCLLMIFPLVFPSAAAEARPIFSAHLTLNGVDHLNDGWFVGDPIPAASSITIGGLTLDSSPDPNNPDDDGTISCNRRAIRQTLQSHVFKAEMKILTSDGFFADPKDTFEEGKRYVIVITVDHEGAFNWDFNWLDNATVGSDYVPTPDEDDVQLRPVYVTVAEKTATRFVLYCPMTLKGRAIRDMYVCCPEPRKGEPFGQSDVWESEYDVRPAIPTGAPYLIGDICWDIYDEKKGQFRALTEEEFSNGFGYDAAEAVKYRLNFSIYPKEGYTFDTKDTETCVWLNGEALYTLRSLDWWMENHPDAGCWFETKGAPHIKVYKEFSCPTFWVDVASLDRLVNLHTQTTAWLKLGLPAAGSAPRDYSVYNSIHPMTRNDRFNVDSASFYTYNRTIGTFRVMPTTTPFTAGDRYRMVITLSPKPSGIDFDLPDLSGHGELWKLVGYEFADTVQALINGSPAGADAKKQEDGCLKVTYTFTLPETKPITSVELIANYPPVDEGLYSYPIPQTGGEGYVVEEVSFVGYAKDTKSFTEANAIPLDPSATFAVGMYYEMRVTLKAENGYAFDPAITDIVVNEQTLPAYVKGKTESNCYVKNTDGTITVRYRYDMAGDDMPQITGYINQNGTAETGKELRFGIKVKGNNVVYRWFVTEVVGGEVQKREISYLLEDDGYDYYLTNEIRFTPTVDFCNGTKEVLYYQCILTNTGGTVESKKIYLNFAHHDTDGKYDFDETNHWHYCVCENMFDVAPHTFNKGTVIKEPTPSAPGERKVKCTVCGYETIETFTPDTPDTPEPDPGKPGDVDGDGIVKTGDARLALRAAIGLEQYEPGTPEFIAADVNKDNVITTGDARIILRAAIGLQTLS